jgi:hypothetical protein
LDLLFDVWTSLRRDPAKAAVAKRAKQLLDPAPVRARASAALGIALDLFDAKTCQTYKVLLPRAVQHADERAAPALRNLTVRRGCGFLSLRDCYGCLRGGQELSLALRNAAKRAAPSFTAPTPVAPATSASAQ